MTKQRTPKKPAGGTPVDSRVRLPAPARAANEDPRQLLAERLEMYRWRQTELLALPVGDQSVAILFSQAPSPDMLDWLAWYATAKAQALRERHNVEFSGRTRSAGTQG
jgi:hypothetical protein